MGKKLWEERYLNITTVLYLLWFFTINRLWDFISNILTILIKSDKFLLVDSNSFIKWIQYICLPIAWAFFLLYIQELIEKHTQFLESLKSLYKGIIIIIVSIIVLWIATFVMTKKEQIQKADPSGANWPEVLKQE